MELWFWLAIVSAVMSGIGGFTSKIAAHKSLDSGLIVFYSALSGVVLMVPVTLFIEGWGNLSWQLSLFVFSAGLLAAVAGLAKIRSMTYIDTTIFYPLFKLFGPLVTIIFGVVLFSESFTTNEWLGLIMSLFIPLLLITKVEKTRQKNLVIGLWYMLLCAVISALYAAALKFAVDSFQDVLWILTVSGVGVFTGGILQFLWKNRNTSLLEKIIENTSRYLLLISVLRGITLTLSSMLLLYAFFLGGPLGIVYTIQSLYILLPIILAIWFYNEHWNAQKVVAIIFSVLALGLMG